MKSKKLLCMLLSLVMALGLMPMAAFAAEPAASAGTLLQKGVSGGTYLDKTAEPGKDYEYTVKGSDGSVQTVQVAAANTEPTGNGVKPGTGTTEVYYEKVTDPANANGEGYLLVTGNKAVTHAPGVKTVEIIDGNRINGEHTDAEWIVATEPGKMSFANGAKRLTISQTKKGSGEHGWLFFPANPWKNFQYAAEVGNNSDSFEPVISGDSFKLFRDHNERSYNDDPNKMVFVYLTAGTGVGTIKKVKDATSFTLFQRKEVTTQAGWVVDTAGLDALIAEANTREQSKYEPATWAPFDKALKAAEKAKKDLAASYETQEQANAALEEIDRVHNQLKAAMDALKLLPPPETITPEITWQRTKEVKNGGRGHKLVTNLPNFKGTDYQKIVWDWNKIRKLTTDPSMTVWDYNTNAQYAAFEKLPGVTAATWNKSYTGDWTDSSVRKFTGTFEWPAGYTLTDKAIIESVNDANYQGIYSHVNDNPELKARFGDKKVIPVNDDMYVYIYKDGEDPSTWTPEEAAKHLVFWTGTSGKGVWSAGGEHSNDWARTTPATYQDKAAVPAYHGVYPNNADTAGSAEITGFTVKNMKLLHTDGWYTMVGTNTLMSTLNRLYPGQQLSGKMHIDIYAFDNSDKGGMDKLNIRFEKAPATTAPVTVKYWLNDTTGTPLGTTVINGAEIGSTIKLPQGTAVNELNHYKAAAITKANADVTDGKPDYGTDGYIVKRSNNVINVVYTAKNQGEVTYYTYDFGVENQYTYAAGGRDLSGAELINAAEGFGSEVKIDNAGNVTFTYTPQNALGTPARATLRLSRGTGHFDVNICVIPASNVLHEENFMTADWDKTGHAAVTVKDNDTSVYGYTGVYSNSADANGVYTARMTAANDMSSSLTFDFNGIGLDVIGNCGPATGTAVIRITNADTQQYVRGFVVDTYFNDNARGEIYQVPLIHAMGLPAGVKYHVEITGLYTNRTQAAVMANGMGGSAIAPEVYSALVELGFTDDEIMATEFIGMEDVLGANTMALDEATTAAPAAAAEQTVAVDGFRVYRSTEKAAAAYTANEQNLIYTNVMDEAITGSFYAYVEQSEATGEYTTQTYEGKGGPENELYLPANTGISFRLNTQGVAAPYAQVSLRAVDGATEWNHQSITHNTEMYYEVSVDSGLVTITNTGSDLLGIGNLKTNCPIAAFDEAAKTQAVQTVMMLLGVPEEPEQPSVPAKYTVAFELADGAVWADETIPATERQTAVLDAENASAALPEIVLPRGMKLLGWSAKDIGLMIPAGKSVTLEALNGFEWNDAEPTVIFQPVMEELPAVVPARFHVVFQLTDGAAWENDRFAPDETREYDLYFGHRNLRAPEVDAPEGMTMTGWKAQDIDLTLAEGERLTLRDLKDGFTWYDAAPTVTFVPVFEADVQVQLPEPEPQPEPAPEPQPEPEQETEPAEPVVFKPEYLDLALVSEDGVYTLTVKASSDVHHLTVNGEEVSEYAKKPDFNVFTHTREGYQLYEIVAYDVNGNASETYLR